MSFKTQKSDLKVNIFKGSYGRGINFQDKPSNNFIQFYKQTIVISISYLHSTFHLVFE